MIDTTLPDNTPQSRDSLNSEGIIHPDKNGEREMFIGKVDPLPDRWLFFGKIAKNITTKQTLITLWSLWIGLIILMFVSREIGSCNSGSEYLIPIGIMSSIIPAYYFGRKNKKTNYSLTTRLVGAAILVILVSPAASWALGYFFFLCYGSY